ncbi:hypothetical protein TURU_030538 [Turdus rufiventris]|nr:hypothetical protein TURU_030538 [Turdus rufiventris]
MQPQITLFRFWIEKILSTITITMQMSLELLDHAGTFLILMACLMFIDRGHVKLHVPLQELKGDHSGFNLKFGFVSCSV